MLIVVKTATREEIEFETEPRDEVERVQELLEQERVVPGARQRLILSGKQKDVDETASVDDTDGRLHAIFGSTLVD